jgi:molybdate transport system substrate-binding protein
LISKSSLFAEDMKAYDKNGVHWIDVDTDLYTPIRQAAVILRSGKDNPDAKLFYEFLFSAKAKAVFTKYGYGD